MTLDESNQMAIRHECLRRAMEVSAHIIKTLTEAKTNEPKLLSNLGSTISDANDKLKAELKEMK